MKQTKNRGLSITFQILAVLIIITTFLFLVLKYLDISTKVEEDPRFVKIDYKQLQKEADAIGNPSSLTNTNAKNVFVLTYHVISNGPPQDEYDISYDQFKDNMFALKRAGYQTISLQDFYLFMGGEKEIPDKSFILTFDDAAKAGYYNADPILKALNYTAVMFVITGHSLGENQSVYYLNELELLEVQQTGRWELESHTYESHFRRQIDANGNTAPVLTNKLWISEESRIETNEEFFARVSTDIKKSKELLEIKFNQPVIAFALPYGDFGESGSNYPEARNIIYDLTTSTSKLVFYEFPIKNKIFKGNYPGSKQDSYLVTRLPADSLRTPDKLLQKIEASRSLELPYYEHYTNYDSWPRISGIASFENDSIILKNDVTPVEDILFAYLDGSYLWEDYTYSIQLKNKQASKISLLSRLTYSVGKSTSSLDYVSCQYTKESVSLINANRGVQTKIVSEQLTNKTDLKAGTILSMSVKNNMVSCSMNGKQVISKEVPNISSHGGVGVKAEDFATQNKTFAFGGISILNY
ncbi:polysaccharide deacetylase family protein [Candidatus Woesearchaeota archaeon]|nr:polysaccharide deacetylase family protein [Candidatus Woesearchaeota archaeon]